ncbi:ABC transporter permease [Natrarchaeobius halalkaliphilus]|uniref:ABC transporter permease n=1 Tax=Natrarchaeobius halalkaliphilus TaxID=1679091 RepID=A0A3N6LI18_9EURY|nr:ABC transporter permease [Natrarchaeobius halalkaliphilus]RQG86719.1 ABC transporter permease [Natrarchaeobius halalkaliphilus]
MSSKTQTASGLDQFSSWLQGSSRALGLVSVLLLLAVWQATAIYVNNPLLLPDIPAVSERLWEMFLVDRSVYPHIWASLYRVAVGFIAAVLIGVPLGLLMGSSSTVEYLLEPYISTLYPVPRIAFYPLLLVILGFGHSSKIAIIFVEALIPIILGAYYGVGGVQQRYLWSARNFGASQLQTFREVILPGSLPYIFSGIRMAMPIAIIVTVVTEMISASQGIGYLIIYSQASFEPETVFAAVIVISAIGVLFDRLLAVIRERLLFWAKDVSMDI